MRWISSLAVIVFVAGVQAAEPKADGLAELRWLVGECQSRQLCIVISSTSGLC